MVMTQRLKVDQVMRFYINLGKMDKINPAKLIGFINENLRKRDVEIGQIEILKSFSFFEIDKNYRDDVLEKLKSTEFNGRDVIVEVTNKPKSRGRNRSKKRNFEFADRNKSDRNRNRSNHDRRDSNKSRRRRR